MARDVEIVLKATDKASKVIEGVGKKTKKAGIDFASLGKSLIAAGAAFTGFAIAAKKGLEFAEQGAKVEQTTESFGLLLNKLDAAPDLLDQLQRASKGTISDMDLMSSTATLLAGASGDLGTALANATPELMRIAKAANKLNPALGDTAFMYQSIATGVKRAQPLILDNLGLTIKVGDANKKLAEQLGKSVDALTAEEKSMAILNATLEAGNVMIDQVGGSVDSATDGYSRLRTEMKNTADILSRVLNAAVSANIEETETAFDVVNKYATALLTLTKAEGAFDLAQQRGIITAEEHNEVLRAVYFTSYTAADAFEWLTIKVEEFEAGIQASSDAVGPIDLGLQQVAGSTEEAAEATAYLTDESWKLRNAQLANKTHAYELTQKLDEYREAAQKAAWESTNLMDSLDRKVASPIADFIADLKWWIGGGEEINRAFEALRTGVEKGIIPEDVGLRLAGELLEGAVDLENELGMIDLSQAEQKLADGLGIPIEEARDRITGTDSVQSALDQVNTTAIEKAIADGLGVPLKDVIGLIDGSDSIKSSLETLIPHWAAQNRALGPVQDTVSGIKSDWDSLNDKSITLTVKYKVEGEPPPGYQHGGSMIVPPGFPNDTFPIMVSSGERVDVTPRGGGIGTLNLNQTINASRGMDLEALADIIWGRANEAAYNAGRAGVNYTGI